MESAHQPALRRPQGHSPKPGAIALAPAAALAAAETATPALPADFSAMVAEKLPAVVGILGTAAAPSEPQAGPRLPPGLQEFFGLPQPGTSRGAGGDGLPRRMQAQGSGFIISPDGHVVTNNHVIAGAEEIEVVFDDGRQAAADPVGADPATDIALLKVAEAAGLPAVEWGDSDAVRIGEWLAAIGNPFGPAGTVTAGILSARSRDIRSGPSDDFLQTDAPINRGNSGGPPFDAEGRVLGVNTAIISPRGGRVGIGFGVPAEVARSVVDPLRETGRARGRS